MSELKDDNSNDNYNDTIVSKAAFSLPPVNLDLNLEATKYNQQWGKDKHVSRNSTQSNPQRTSCHLDDESSYHPTSGVNYVIEDASLFTLLRIRPRISDAILNSGTFLTWKAESNDEDFQRIQRYFQNSRGTPVFQIKSILRIIRVDDVEPHALDEGLRMMLFHGTKEWNIGDILHTGLLPSMSRHEGGIFFADRVAKSMKYCRNGNKDPSGGWLFLCEVLLGTMFHANYWSREPPVGFHSIKRAGWNIPNENENESEDGVLWPVGKTVKLLDEESKPFRHNEYIVFCERQARPRYLIEYEKIQLHHTGQKLET